MFNFKRFSPLITGIKATMKSRLTQKSGSIIVKQ